MNHKENNENSYDSFEKSAATSLFYRRYDSLSHVDAYLHRIKTSTDPAAKFVPLRGKLLWTYALMFISFFLMVVSIIVGRGIVPLSENPLLGPSIQALLTVGGLRGENVRNGDWWRLLWAPYLHAGWFHLAMNFLLWYKLGMMIEPDWGFMRTTFVFVFSSMSGNLLSATLAPNTVSVGASGGIFGIMGGCVPYVMEYWHTIPQPKCMMYVVLASLLIGLACGFMPYVDNNAHIGGAIGGVLLGFMTITKVEAWLEKPARHNSLFQQQSTMATDRIDLRKSLDLSSFSHYGSKGCRRCSAHFGRLASHASIPRILTHSRTIQMDPDLYNTDDDDDKNYALRETNNNLSHDCRESRNLQNASSVEGFSYLGENLSKTQTVINLWSNRDEFPVKSGFIASSSLLKQKETGHVLDSSSQSYVRNDQQPSCNYMVANECRPCWFRDRRVSWANIDEIDLKQRDLNRTSLRRTCPASNTQGTDIEICSSIELPRNFSFCSEADVGHTMTKDLSTAALCKQSTKLKATTSPSAPCICSRYNSFPWEKWGPCKSATHPTNPGDIQHEAGHRQSITSNNASEIADRLEILKADNEAYQQHYFASTEGRNSEEAADDHQGNNTLKKRLHQRCDQAFDISGKASTDSVKSQLDYSYNQNDDHILNQSKAASLPEQCPNETHQEKNSSTMPSLGRNGTTVRNHPTTSKTARFALPTEDNKATEVTGDPSAVVQISTMKQESNLHGQSKSAHYSDCTKQNGLVPNVLENSKSTNKLKSKYFAYKLIKTPFLWRPRTRPRLRVPSRVTLRSTRLEDIDDSFIWNDKRVWAVRVVSALLLATFWLPLFYFLLVCPSCYSPPGPLFSNGQASKAASHNAVSDRKVSEWASSSTTSLSAGDISPSFGLDYHEDSGNRHFTKQLEDKYRNLLNSDDYSFFPSPPPASTLSTFPFSSSSDTPSSPYSLHSFVPMSFATDQKAWHLLQKSDFIYDDNLLLLPPI